MILGFLGKFALHVHRWALWSSPCWTKIPVSPLIAVAEALGWRFVAGCVFALYLGHHDFREALNAAVKLLF